MIGICSGTFSRRLTWHLRLRSSFRRSSISYLWAIAKNSSGHLGPQRLEGPAAGEAEKEAEAEAEATEVRAAGGGA